MDRSESRKLSIESIIRRDGRTNPLAAADQIILSADAEDDFEAGKGPRLLDASLMQESWRRGRIHGYEIFNRSYLIQTVKRYRDKAPRKYRVSLAWLDPKPETVQRMAWRWLSTALTTAIWAVVLFYMVYIAELKLNYLDSVAILLSAMALLSLCMFFYSNQNKLVFNSYLSHLPLVEIDINKPDKAAFDSFVDEIRSGIYAGWQNKDIQQLLVGEISELRRLRDAGVLSEASYSQACADIFKYREYQIKSVQIAEALEQDEAGQLP